MSTDFAAEFSRLFQGGCGVASKDWTKPELFDGTDARGCYANEAALVESITSEAYDKYGFEVDYYVKDISTRRDELLGEDPLWNVTRRFRLKVYTEQVPDLQKQYQLQGMVFTELVTVQCTIAHFEEASMYSHDRATRKDEWATVPRIGDIMYFQYCDKYYEVVNVKAFAEGSTFLGKPVTYTFTLRIWRNGHEDVDLGKDAGEDLPIEDYTALAETFDMDPAAEGSQSTVRVTDKDGNGDYLAVNPDCAMPDTNKDYIPGSDSKWDDDWGGW